jgi:hypothetical protein
MTAQGDSGGGNAVSDSVDEVCEHIIIVTEGRLQRSDLDADTRLWSPDGDASSDLDSLEVLALLYRLEAASGHPLPPEFELRVTVTVGDIADFLEQGSEAR